MRKTHRSGLSLAPWLLGLIIPVILSGCQVAGGGRFDSNQALAFGSIAVALFLLVMLVVQRSRYMRLLEDEVKKTGEKVREEADRRVEAARAEAAKEIKDKIAEARKEGFRVPKPKMTSKAHRGRAFRGLTSSGKKMRALGKT